MKNLHHQHIVNLNDVFSDGVNIYLVMELLAGGDLFDRVVKKGKYTEEEAKGLMRQLFDAISYLHAQGIAHRDLKLENIMLVSQDNDVDIKVTDFGLAKTEGKLKTFCGTPNYYAPEVLERRYTVRGEGSYSVAADMWSCGVMLYVLLSGEMPWKGNNIDKAIREVKYTPMIGRKWVHVSDNAKALIKSLLDPSPTRRLSVQQAIVHPWFGDNSAQSSEVDFKESCDVGTKMSIVESNDKEEIRSPCEDVMRTGMTAVMDTVDIQNSTSEKAKVRSGTASGRKRKATDSLRGETPSQDMDLIMPNLTNRRTLPRKCKSQKCNS